MMEVADEHVLVSFNATSKCQTNVFNECVMMLEEDIQAPHWDVSY